MTATPMPIGGYVLNGTKTFITNAGFAEVYIVIANTDKGPSAFIVRFSDSPGFTVGEQEHKMGIRGSSTCPLYFDNVSVPQSALLGQEGAGFKIAMKTLDSGRLGVAAQAVGIGQAALEASVKYAKERVQFGKPIGTFGPIQEKLADMATEVEAARLLTYAAAEKIDAHEPYGTAIAMAKLFASEMATRVTGKAIQIHGGAGFTEAYPVERFYRDAKITEIYEGTSEIQRMVIARAAMK
jgi:butyryl-CoA dehydrogenase